MHSSLKFFIIVFFIFFSMLSIAKTTLDVHCPTEVTTRQSIENIPSGFASMSANTPHYLSNITFYAGKPEQQASLAPDKMNKDRMHWIFSENETIYLSCGYHQTKIELYKVLPKGIHTCTVFYDTTTQSAFGGIPKKIKCSP